MSDGHHGLSAPAGSDFVARSRFHHGRFGRLFPNLDPAEHDEKTLRDLAKGMEDPNEPSVEKGGGWGGGKPKKADGDNPTIPAGYTYLGQFIDHDITFDPASSLLRDNDPDALHNFRTPRFDLDNVYGEGPSDEPFLYDADTGKSKMLLGQSVDGKGKAAGGIGSDLPRNSQGTALIGDPRNDENSVVAQLQLAFLRAHNKFVDEVDGFGEARRQLRWHYQYVVVNDFLRRIVPKKVLDDLLPKNGRVEWCELCHCEFGHELPFMPVEFSVAAYRFGHSMVRPAYDLNANARNKEIFDDDSPAKDLTDLRGFRPLPVEYEIEWKRFFPNLGEPNPQPSRLIDIKLAAGLAGLPGEPAEFKNLAVRNLLRGKRMRLPWGEAVAKRLGQEVVPPSQVLDGVKLSKAQRKELEGRTPLWFYILREAEKLGGGQTLGPVGGWIVAKTLICLLAGDRFSYVNIEPGWTPKAAGLVKQKAKKAEGFEIADLIRFATN